MNKLLWKRTVRPFTLRQEGIGRGLYVFLEIELREGKQGPVLSITGVEGPNRFGNCRGGCGQIHMSYARRGQNDPDLIHVRDLEFAPGWTSEHWWKLLEIWDAYHLNDLHAECEHQEKLGWTWETHPSAICPECGYRLGSAWTYRPIPPDVLDWLQNLPPADKPYPWH